MRLSQSPKRVQKGVALLESLIALLIFSLGVLAIVSLQATSARASAEAAIRADAALLANQVIGLMWADDRAQLANYAYKADAGTGSLCEAAFAAGASAASSSPAGDLASWLGESSKPGSVLGTLPGAQARIQVLGAGTTNIVSVTLCWRSNNTAAGGDGRAIYHSYETVAQIQG